MSDISPIPPIPESPPPKPAPKKRGRPPKTDKPEKTVVKKPQPKTKVIQVAPTEPEPEPSEDADSESSEDIEDYLAELVKKQIAKQTKKKGVQFQDEEEPKKSGFGFNPAYLIPVALPFVRLAVEYAVKFGTQTAQQPVETLTEAVKKPDSPVRSHFEGVL